MLRMLAGLMAAALGADALVQLFQPYWWYGVVPGVVATGPFNAHFVRDVGAAYLVTAAGLGWFAWRPLEGWPALAAGAGFLTLHAAIHVFDAVCGTTPLRDALRDLGGVYLTAALALGIALAAGRGLASKENAHAQSHPRAPDRPVRAHLGL